MFSITGNSVLLGMADCLVLYVEKGSEAKVRLEEKDVTTENNYIFFFSLGLALLFIFYSLN